MEKKLLKLPLIFLLNIFIFINVGCSNNTKTVQTSPEIQNKLNEEITATEEILNADMYDNKIQLANNVLNLPAQYEEFISAGAIMTNDNNTSENTIIDPDSSKEYKMIVRSSEFKLYSKNESNNEGTIKNSQIQHISTESGNEIFFAKGVRVGDTFDDVIKKWGEPSCKDSLINNNNLIYHYYKFPITEEIKNSIIDYKTHNDDNIYAATHDQYIINVDRVTGTVKSIEYRWNINNNNQKTISVKNIKYKAPYSFTDHEFFNLRSVENIDNIDYIIVLPDNVYFTKNKLRDEVSIRKDIPNEEFTDYNFEILKETDTELHACEFYKNSNNSFLGRFVYVSEDNHYISSWCQIISFNQDEILTDNAINVFKDKIKDLSLSVCKDK